MVRYAAKSKSVADGNSMHIPADLQGFRVFQDAFHNLMESDPNLREPLKPGKHTPWMGVPVLAERADVRNTISNSWMTQPGICRITAGSRKAEADKACALYTSFVIGGLSNDSGLPSDCVEDKDCISVPEEGLYVNKTRSFFRYALHEFPWATHVGKSDTDAFPFMYKVLPQMLDGQYTLMGDMFDFDWCGGHDNICPPVGCGKPIGGNLLQYSVSDGKTCWSYPQGAFYILSRSMALGAFDEQIQSALPYNADNDDIMVGWSVHEYARRRNVRALTWSEDVRTTKLSDKMWLHQPWAYANLNELLSSFGR
eukprot:TRINITY_DN24211_c0_g1_i3.p1 TRINITY_DN24211_c0_g1~~TRINITY_DN24211_c0_g1_i3.p1  ORF type:complete len:311 (-),score=19.30 TRINITY_DN24211_c0_g1_i3:319-1251(-)